MSRVIGSKAIETTNVENYELVNYRGENNSFTKASSLKSLAFIALSDCTVKINNGTEILIQSGESLEFEFNEMIIDSFIISEKGTKFRYVAIV